MNNIEQPQNINTTQLKDTAKALITSVQIKQSFLKLHKMTNNEDYLIKANSWNTRIEDLKQSIRILNKYGSYDNFMNILINNGDM